MSNIIGIDVSKASLDCAYLRDPDQDNTADRFLGLSADELAYIELKLALSNKLKAKRVSKKLTQAEFAQVMNSSQSRVAKMEAGDPAVSIDLLIKSLLALGVSKKELGRSIS